VATGLREETSLPPGQGRLQPLEVTAALAADQEDALVRRSEPLPERLEPAPLDHGAGRRCLHVG
jgi:hypothetical protein